MINEGMNMVKVRSSENYAFTADVMSANDMIKLAELKKTVQHMSKYSPTKYRVVLRGRKPIEKMKVEASYLTPASKGPVSYDRGGNIVGGIKNASMIDVYVYTR